jgi:hypothetical protein
MSLSSFSSLASTAFDTARSTIRAMADAAVPPAGTSAVTNPPAVPAPPVAAEAAATPPAPAKGGRVGTVLDAYA